MKHHFIVNSGEEAPFYWHFEKGGTILLGKFGSLVEWSYVIDVSKTMLAVGLSFIL